MLLSAARAFELADSAEPLPHVPELQPLYDSEIVPRRGDLIMVVGRPGSQKSGFVLFWCAKMGLPTLYFNGDSSNYEMTSRLISMNIGQTIPQIDEGVKIYGRDYFAEAIKLGSNIHLVNDMPITLENINLEIDAWVELHNARPDVIVVDNLMDMEEVGSEYESQRLNMIELRALSKWTGSTVIVTHHSREMNDSDLEVPPARADIANRLSQKPQEIYGVALYDGGQPDKNGNRMPKQFRVSPLKQRLGRSDPSGKQWARLNIAPEYTMFWGKGRMPEW